MKINKICFILILFIIFSTLFAIFFWNKVHFTPTLEVIKNFQGTVYILNNYNHWNEIIKYILFVGIPALLFLFYLILSKNFIIPESNFYNNENLEKKKNLKLFFIFFILTILNFLFSNSPLQEVDILHEGMWLTAWENYKHYGSFWVDSFITVGWGQEFFVPFLSSIIFGDVSIESTRFIILFYKLVNQITLIILVYNLSFEQKLDRESKNTLFIFLSLFGLYLTNINSPIISPRELPIIISLILIWNFLNNKKIFFNLILIGFFSSSSIFWSLDRGIILNILTLLLIFFLFWNKKFKLILVLCFSIFIFWYLFFLIFGKEDFYSFLENFKWIVTNYDYIFGLIHPVPFGNDLNSSRAGKNIIIILTTTFLLIFFIFSKNKILSYENKIFLFFLLCLSFVSYKTALGRSDGPHLKTGVSYFIFSIIYTTCLIGCNFFKKKFFTKLLKILIFIIVILILPNIKIEIKKTIFVNFPNNKENEFYYSSAMLENYKKIKEFLKDEICVNNITYDALLPYVISKPSCNRYYFVYSLGGIKIQEEYIKYLESSKSKRIIIKKKEKYINNSPEQLLILFNYINQNYKVEAEIDNYLILKEINFNKKN